MCDFIDCSYFNLLPYQSRSYPEQKNCYKFNHKILFQDSNFNLKFCQNSQFLNQKTKNVSLVKHIQSNIDVYLNLTLQESEFSIKARKIQNLIIQPIRCKQIRKILIKEISKRYFISMIQPYRVQMSVDTGDWFIKTPMYNFQSNIKQFHKILHSQIEPLVKKIVETLSFIQKIIKRTAIQTSQISTSKTQKFNQILRYFTRCSTAPSLSIKSDCAEYQSSMNRYAASRCDLQELQKYHKQTLIQSNHFLQSMSFYGYDVKIDCKQNYLCQISLKQKQKIQDQISIPSYVTTKSKQNKFIFNHCYFYNNKYDQRKIAEGGNSQVFLIKPEIYEYSSTVSELDIDFQKYQNVSKYVTKHLIYKSPVNQRSSSPLINTKQISFRQTEIVSYFRGGSCLFLPKYYLNIEKNSTYTKKLFVQYLNGQSLDIFLTLHAQTISLYTKLYLILQTLQALRFINNFNIVHLDVKQNNIIVSKKLICKLFDFGQSYHFKICGQYHKPKYTRIYASPEVITSGKGRIFTQKSDVFSLGIMMHNIIFGKHPYFFANKKSFQKCNIKGQLRSKIFYVPEEVEEYGNKFVIDIFYQLILKSIDMDESKRPYLDWITVVLRSCFNLITFQ